MGVRFAQGDRVIGVLIVVGCELVWLLRSFSGTKEVCSRSFVEKAGKERLGGGRTCWLSSVQRCKHVETAFGQRSFGSPDGLEASLRRNM